MSTSVRRRSPTGIDSRPALANRTHTAIDHAVRLIHSVCCLAGSATLIADFRQHLIANRIDQAIAAHDTAALFDWLLVGFGFQGISNQIAFNYMQRHGLATWRQLTVGLETKGTCPKLRSYWQFADCGYRKGIFTCSEPSRIETCCLPELPLRNGRLSQNACSLYLFTRDVMEGDLVGWVDRHLAQADQPPSIDRIERMRAALIDPLRQIHGVADKVLAMVLATLLIGGSRGRPRWFEVGVTLVAVDTLVHNFLHRTGILSRFEADHPYGDQCYRTGRCADLIEQVAARIDARQFNPDYPANFPRFVQHAIWRYCAQQGLNVCNGTQIDDRLSCNNPYCRLSSHCERSALKPSKKLVITSTYSCI